MHSEAKAKPIVRTDGFQRDVESLSAKYPRIGDAVEGAIELLKRKPDYFPMKYVDFGIRAIPIGPWPGVPKAVIWFQTPKAETRLIAVVISEDESE